MIKLKNSLDNDVILYDKTDVDSITESVETGVLEVYDNLTKKIDAIDVTSGGISGRVVSLESDNVIIKEDIINLEKDALLGSDLIASGTSLVIDAAVNINTADAPIATPNISITSGVMSKDVVTDKLVITPTTKELPIDLASHAVLPDATVVYKNGLMKGESLESLEAAVVDIAQAKLDITANANNISTVGADVSVLTSEVQDLTNILEPFNSHLVEFDQFKEDYENKVTLQDAKDVELENTIIANKDEYDAKVLLLDEQDTNQNGRLDGLETRATTLETDVGNNRARFDSYYTAESVDNLFLSKTNAASEYLSLEYLEDNYTNSDDSISFIYDAIYGSDAGNGRPTTPIGQDSFITYYLQKNYLDKNGVVGEIIKSVEGNVRQYAYEKPAGEEVTEMLAEELFVPSDSLLLESYSKSHDIYNLTESGGLTITQVITNPLAEILTIYDEGYDPVNPNTLKTGSWRVKTNTFNIPVASTIEGSLPGLMTRQDKELISKIFEGTGLTFEDMYTVIDTMSNIEYKRIISDIDSEGFTADPTNTLSDRKFNFIGSDGVTPLTLKIASTNLTKSSDIDLNVDVINTEYTINYAKSPTDGDPIGLSGMITAQDKKRLDETVYASALNINTGTVDAPVIEQRNVVIGAEVADYTAPGGELGKAFTTEFFNPRNNSVTQDVVYIMEATPTTHGLQSAEDKVIADNIKNAKMVKLTPTDNDRQLYGLGPVSVEYGTDTNTEDVSLVFDVGNLADPNSEVIKNKVVLPVATTDRNGLLSNTDKAKLDDLETGGVTGTVNRAIGSLEPVFFKQGDETYNNILKKLADLGLSTPTVLENEKAIFFALVDSSGDVVTNIANTNILFDDLNTPYAAVQRDLGGKINIGNTIALNNLPKNEEDMSIPVETIVSDTADLVTATNSLEVVTHTSTFFDGTYANVDDVQVKQYRDVNLTTLRAPSGNIGAEALVDIDGNMDINAIITGLVATVKNLQSQIDIINSTP